jgi:GxxExxY protein
MERSEHPLIHDEITGKAIGGFYDVYNELSGYPEYVLRRALVIVFNELGLTVQEEVQLPVTFRGHKLTTFRADLIIDPGIIVEVKTAPQLAAYQKAQVLHYLKASGLEVGLLFNFGRQPEFARVVYQSARKRSESREPSKTEGPPADSHRSTAEESKSA